MLKFKDTIEEVPIDRDPITKLVPWIVAVLVFLMCLVLAGASSLGNAMSKWQWDMQHRVTLEIPLRHELDRERITSALSTYLKTKKVVQSFQVADKHKLHAIYGIENAHPQDLDRDFSLPVMVDLTLVPDETNSLTSIATELQTYMPGIRFETYTQWYDMLSLLQRSSLFIAAAFTFLILLAVIIVISLVTRSGMLAHQENIEILRLIGASNSYVAKKFQKNAFLLSTKGALCGFLLAIPITIFLNVLLNRLGGQYLLLPTYDHVMILLLPFVPFFVILLSVCVSRLAVLKSLKNI